jgi:hypothetical protein
LAVPQLCVVALQTSPLPQLQFWNPPHPFDTWPQALAGHAVGVQHLSLVGLQTWPLPQVQSSAPPQPLETWPHVPAG